MKLKLSSGTMNILSLEREGRHCDIQELNAQVGWMNIFAISGGRVVVLNNSDGDTVGVAYPIDATRRVEVVLDYNDTYIVSRVRYVVRGSNANTEVIEHYQDGIFCDFVGETALRTSCWK
jgi:hypothetical protein